MFALAGMSAFLVSRFMATTAVPGANQPVTVRVFSDRFPPLATGRGTYGRSQPNEIVKREEGMSGPVPLVQRVSGNTIASLDLHRAIVDRRKHLGRIAGDDDVDDRRAVALFHSPQQRRG